jgi:hypothetical protein
VAVDSRGWRGYGATRIGASHTNAGRPSQDALAIVPPPDAAGDIGFTAVTVADGHGHPRHFRSGRGSQFAVEVATEAVRDTVDAIRDATGFAEVDAVWRLKAGPTLLSAWLDAVAEDVGATPITIQEQAVGGLGPDADFEEIVYAYGATLIVAAVTGRWLLTAQIGDGDLFAIRPDGQIARLFPADPRLDGSRTTSLCQPDALDSMRFGVSDLADGRIAAVMLATDGYGNAQARDDWDVAFGNDIAGLATVHGVPWISDQLARWAERCASSDGSGDDVTLAMLFAPDPRWQAVPAAKAPQGRPVSQVARPARHLGAPEEPTVPMTAAGVPLMGRPVSPADPTVQIVAAPTVPIVPAASWPVPAEPTVAMPSAAADPTVRDVGSAHRSRGIGPLIGGVVLLLAAAAILYFVVIR